MTSYKIGDFGEACITCDDEKVEDFSVGSPFYMSPEMYQNLIECQKTR